MAPFSAHQRVKENTEEAELDRRGEDFDLNFVSGIEEGNTKFNALHGLPGSGLRKEDYRFAVGEDKVRQRAGIIMTSSIKNGNLVFHYPYD